MRVRQAPSTFDDSGGIVAPLVRPRLASTRLRVFDFYEFLCTVALELDGPFN
jgi:hypothetical protein